MDDPRQGAAERLKMTKMLTLADLEVMADQAYAERVAEINAMTARAAAEYDARVARLGREPTLWETVTGEDLVGK